MSQKRLKRQILKKRLFTKNRLVILNEDTFEEIISLKLTLMNVFVVATIGAILIIFVTTYIIAFSPLREFIPGYSSSKLKKEATELALKSDSLVRTIKTNEAYIQSIKKVLTGELEFAKFNKDSIIAANGLDASKVDFNPTDEELNLREQVAKEDKYSKIKTSLSKEKVVFSAPVKGKIIEKYDPKTKNFGISIALTKKTPIKAILGGTVIFADWIPSTGNVIKVKHNNGFISIYKNAVSLSKSKGNRVKTGEIIAIAGPVGKKSSTINLYFELWKDRYSIDPTQFIKFE